MSKSPARSAIRLWGVRQNNLKNFDLDLPLNQLIVVTGLSGSGKSSFAFDTLFAEGQRRYIETFSPYARQFFDRMDKPQVDSIEGIPPAIAIEQRNAVKTTRSTVGTMTEICDYLKLLWPNLAQLHCRQCGRKVRKDSPQRILQSLQERPELNEVLITFDLPLTEKLSLDESLALISKQGYQRLLIEHRIVRLEEANPFFSAAKSRTFLTVVQDRVRISSRARFVEACEQAYHFGKGRLTIHFLAASGVNKGSAEQFSGSARFSNRLHCAECDIDYHEPSPALFSFNHPVGACPSCKGFGRIISIDFQLAIPDRSKTLAEGVVRPWQTGQGAECQTDLLRACRHFKIPTDVPFEKLPKKWQDFVVEGEPDYGKDEEHEWPRAWYGVKGYFRWLESKSYKMHVRVLLSRYRAYTPCPACNGTRFQPDALLYRLPIFDLRSTTEDLEKTESAESAPTKSSIVNPKSSITLADFYALPIRDALALIDKTSARKQQRSSANDPIHLALDEVRSRLRFLEGVGLGYLTLDRPTRSLSGGETERVNLTTCLGTRLVNTLFVLDEPSVGLHPRDTERLVRVLQQLRDAGNTVVVVEHEASVMRAANQIVDLGPGHGAAGGEVVFQGTYAEILRSEQSLTGQYLSGRKRIDIPPRRLNGSQKVPRISAPSAPTEDASSDLALNEASVPFQAATPAPMLKVTGINRHNLKDVSVEIPLGKFVCLTGVSGSGKTTLAGEVLLPLVDARLRSRDASAKFAVKASERFDDETAQEGEEESNSSSMSPSGASISGFEHLGRIVMVDQSILGKTPRSNPAVYIGAFDDIRDVFAQTELAKQRGLNASAFSFNSAQGQCERCRGAGFEKIEMQFLSDVFIRCPDCNGRRYRAHILEVKVSGARSQVSGETKEPSSPVMRPGTTHLKPDTSHLAPRASHLSWSIADMLDATVDEAIEFLSSLADSRPAQRAADSLKLLQEVGLGYLRLGQPINTLSGGESQRLKLVRHLAETAAVESRESATESSTLSSSTRQSTLDIRPTLFLFDEPTTGLHFEDVRVLLKVFQRLVNAGHSVLVIEHNLDVIKSADWLIDLGPDAGDQGGQIVAEGTPEKVSQCKQSHTGQALKSVLKMNS
jgi:excinuclease ABC subunit A